MIPELGHFALALACAIAFAQAILPIWGAHRGDARLMAAAPALATAQLLALVAAAAALVWSSVSDDFTVLNVAENSHTLKPLLYKITGTWGNHEGSILLWGLILALCGGAVAAFGRGLPSALRARVIGVLGGTSAGFLLFCLLASNPFTRLWPPPFDGQDMNPLLQDPGLAFHPPILYSGYVGFAVPFAFAVAALLEGRVDASWGRWVRPWTLASWCLLTSGIALGSWWAYYELGWGGFWFWDPVENASLLPWLTGTALLHSAIVVEKREALKVWTVLLAIGTFSLSLSGTFLVRSGILNSVHAFANDPDARRVHPRRCSAIVIGGSLLLFALRAPVLSPGGLFSPLSREGALVVNNIFLCSAAAVIITGTLYPLIADMVFNHKISVGAPFFNMTVLPLTIPVFTVMTIAPTLAWKRAQLGPALIRLWWAALAALIVGLSVAFGLHRMLPALAFGGAVWIILGAFNEIVTRTRLFRVPLRDSLARLAGLRLAVLGHHAGPCRDGGDGDRDHRHVAGDRAGRAAASRARAPMWPAIPGRSRGCATRPGRTTRRGSRPSQVVEERRAGRDAGAVAPGLPGAADDDDGYGDPHEFPVRPLRRARRGAGWRRACCGCISTRSRPGFGWGRWSWRAAAGFRCWTGGRAWARRRGPRRARDRRCA